MRDTSRTLPCTSTMQMCIRDRLQPAGGVIEPDAQRAAFLSCLAEQRARIFDRLAVGDGPRRQRQAVADLLLVCLLYTSRCV